jgi:putative addiction module killer protein
MARVTQYETEDGAVPFAKWFSSLGARAAAKVTAAVAQMEADNFGDHKSVGGGVWERRIHFEKGYRLYFARDGNDLVLLLCGGTKSRQRADIDEAKRYWKDYQRRKQREKTDERAQARPKRKKRRKK